MFLHRSNRAEVLAERLAEVVATPLGGPFEPECIAVQGKGMERWLTMELAKRHGVWANPDFPFVRAVIERAFQAVLPEERDGAWDSAALTWAAAKGLHSMQGRTGFEAVQSYLQGDDDHRRLLQLSSKVAELYDGYAVYRPELLGEWQRRGGADWQAQLWQALHTEHGFSHVGTREADFLSALAAGTGPIDDVPKRISLFGVSALPPLYVRVLAALAARIEVHVFLLSPSQEYWSDIRSRREVLRAELSEDASEELEVGNELLATLGRLHRDFQYLLERDVEYVDATEIYESPDASTLLGLIQSDILHLRDRNEDSESLTVSTTDQSLTVHSCHGPTRELEVLRDQLLARLDADPTLEARDIIVMTPDIESYAPFIQAVFSETLDREETLPFHIADRAPRSTYPVIDALARVLDVVPGRLSGADVLDLLAIEVVRERFSISEHELPTIQSWVAETNIRWGRDAEHRALEGQPSCELNTWRFGLERLLLGYAAPSRGTDLFANTLAYDDIEGTVTDLLGRFVDFCEAMFALQAPLSGCHTMQQWKSILERTLFSLLSIDDDGAGQHQALRESFSELSTHAETYGFSEELSLGALMPMLERIWAERGTRSNFLSGGISFCQLMPMRSIPHRVVCIVGMNDGAFPKNTPEVGFDLIAANPRLGDRRPRDDDRYLFLEALLSARDALLITYTGQDDQTNARLPASVLVEQLVAIVAQSTNGHEIVLEHPLQPFSPRYFEGGSAELFRYSERDCRAAQALVSERTPQPRFVQTALPADEVSDGDIHTVSLWDFVGFFTQNSRYFLNHRIGLRLEDELEELLPREPMMLEGLAKWQVGDALLRAVLEHGDAAVAMEVLRASGSLPIGTPGRHHLESELPLIEALARMARTFRGDEELPDLEVDFTFRKTRVVGRLDSLWPAGRQKVSYSSLSAKRELGAWLEHLVLCQEATSDYPNESIAIGRNGKNAEGLRFRPVEDPEIPLTALVELFEVGQRSPLPFFPKSSMEFAKQWRSSLEDDASASPEAALAKAQGVFRGGGYTNAPKAEGEDAYVRQIYGAQDPTSPEFEPFDQARDPALSFTALAMTVFSPLLDHREKLGQ